MRRKKAVVYLLLPFSKLLNEVRNESPVWVLTTASLSPHAPFQTWNTPEGPVEVTFQMHSVVITGFDKEFIYVNDPYGQKDRKVDRDHFIASGELMGSQAVVIH
ncbi:C39 family peptidase [Mesobacillus campisalis]|uniref:C39 family peptidase n=1 Tax=Mesobacillus campisalis TaxID=1408103 RepID=UPI00069B8EEF|nr:C39 family peptidase [Mesobacillus campisalis]